MKKVVAIFCLFGFVVAASAQEKSPEPKGATPSAGLPVGAKAPSFALRDQFDRIQSNATLKGPNGMLLLFFRSADW